MRERGENPETKKGVKMTLFCMMDFTKAHLEPYYRNIREQRKEPAIGKSGVLRTPQFDSQPATMRERGENPETKS